MIDNDRYIPKVSQRQPPMLVVYVKSLKFLVRRAPGYAPEKSCDVQHVFLYKMLQNLQMGCSWIFPISRVLGTDSSYIYIYMSCHNCELLRAVDPGQVFSSGCR